MTVTIHRPALPMLDPDLVRRWGAISTTITADLVEGRTLADPAIRPLRPLGSVSRLVGRTRTVRCEPPDFGAVLHGIDRAEPGDVIVIAAGGHRDVAVLGDILGGVARRKGVAGVAIDGAVRDVAELAGWSDFPVFARATTARGPSSREHGALDGPVSFGGVTIVPGTLVVGDDDGLMFLSPAEATGLIAAAEQRRDAEASWVARLQAGEALRDVLGLPQAEVETAIDASKPPGDGFADPGARHHSDFSLRTS
jgi:4-hydroxy-4-methyl-2-oxoglutarate aldolase